MLRTDSFLCRLPLPGTTALESPLPKAAQCARRCEFIRTPQEPYRLLESWGERLGSNTHGAQVNSTLQALDVGANCLRNTS
jgi:hypothetical protein